MREEASVQAAQNFNLLFNLLATAIFVLGSAIVATRLLLLARRSREAPELLLGLAILGTAVLGYGVLIASQIVRLQAAPAIPDVAISLSAVGKVLHDLGVVFFLLFVLKVFRPTERWARALAGGAALLLWVGVSWGMSIGSLRVEPVGSVPWLCEYVVIWSYPLWLTAESLRYWRLMRRRSALGLANPLVTNRFVLWGIGSLFTAVAIWTASAPFFFIDRPELMQALAPTIHLATATAGLVSISCSYLAFLPPAWYRRIVAPVRVSADARAASSA
jgi:hypothetical protein